MTDYSATPEATYQRAYRREHSEAIKRRNLKRLYGLTPEEIEQMRAAQGYRCAICDRHEDDLPAAHAGRPRKDGTPTVLSPKLVLDHCHNGHGNRGIICHECNWWLGRVRDSAALLRAAASYLEWYGCK